MVRRERIVNNAATTLNGGITSGATSITVTDGSVFPTEGDFRIIIDNELLLVTARSTNTLTVTRGIEGTAGASHSNGADVTAVLTAGGIDQLVDDVTAGYSDRYPCRFLDENGNTLTVSDFTWVNQGTATAADDPYGGITMTLPNAVGIQNRLLVRSAPTAPWTLTGLVRFGPGYANRASRMGICARESSSGKILAPVCEVNDLVSCFKFTSATSFSSRLGSDRDNEIDFAWFQLEDNNTNIIARFSFDGINWFEQGSEARGNFPTGSEFDQVGFWADSQNGLDDALYHFQAWVLE